jgi:hypothetical protein
MWILDWLPFWVFHLVVLVGLAGLIGSLVLKFIPFISTYRLPIQVAAIATLVFGVYMEGGIATQEKWEAKVAEVKLEMAKKETASAETTVKVVTKYVNKVQIVKEKGNDIIKQVPVYITKDADAKCDVPTGFVVLHDSASRNEVPDATRKVDATTSSVKISGVAETVVDNYTTYHQVAEQLRSLQEWVREQQKVYGSK